VLWGKGMQQNRLPIGPSNDDLVRRAQVGDREAFNILAVRMEEPLKRHLYSVVTNEFDVDDCLQQTLDYAWAAIGSYDSSRGSVGIWMHMIARSKALSCLQRLKRTLSRMLSVTDFEQINVGRHDATEHRLDAEALLRRIPAKQREAIELVDLQDYTLQEAALIMNTSLNTVHSRRRAGLEKLSDLVGTAPRKRSR
jgi:RNA polymerase sigma-70 factor (ECF subfamily)